MVFQKNTIPEDGMDILSMPVIALPDGKNSLTLSDILNNKICFGGSGTGKTSGVAAWFLNDLLAHDLRIGGLFLTVKADERIRLERIIKAAGREEDMIIINKNNPYKVNAIEYELERTGRKNIDYPKLVDKFIRIFLLGERYESDGESSGEQDRFWSKSLKRLIIRLMMLLVLAEETVSVENMRKILIHCFSADDVENYHEIWKAINSDDRTESENAQNKYLDWCEQNYFLGCFQHAISREHLDDKEKEVLGFVDDYFFKQWPNLSEKTKSIIEESAHGYFEYFLSGILKSHFSSTMSPEVRPELCYQEGKLIIVEVPLKEYEISSIYATGLMKLIFQSCMERRVIEHEENPRPCILFCDEYHNFCTDNDEKFASSCRSVRCGMFVITQSVDGLQVSFGKNNAQAKTKSFFDKL